MSDQQTFDLDIPSERETVSAQVRALQWAWNVKFMITFYTYRRDNATTQEEYNRYQEAIDAWAK